MLHEVHKNLTLEEIKELITYQPISGKAYWNYRDIKWFNEGKNSAQHNWKSWNTRYAGKEITTKDYQGYLRPWFVGASIRLHRLIWFYQTGYWPENLIDHINGIKDDNRWENLREVTSAENNKNQKRYKTNTSGVTGTSLNKELNKWQAYIRLEGKKIHLGVFKTLEEAPAARKAAEKEYGYHDNHGRD